MCVKLLLNEDKINQQIHVIWTENQKYGVFTNFYRFFVDCILGYENIKEKYSELSRENIDIHLNSST